MFNLAIGIFSESVFDKVTARPQFTDELFVETQNSTRTNFSANDYNPLLKENISITQK